MEMYFTYISINSNKVRSRQQQIFTNEDTIYQQCCWYASHLIMPILSPSMVMEDVDVCQKTQGSFEPKKNKKNKNFIFLVNASRSSLLTVKSWRDIIYIFFFFFGHQF